MSQKGNEDDEGSLKDVIHYKKLVAYRKIKNLPKIPSFKKDIITILLKYDIILNELPPVDDFGRQLGKFSKSSYLKFKKEDLVERYNVMNDCVYQHNKIVMMKDKTRAIARINRNMTPKQRNQTAK